MFIRYLKYLRDNEFSKALACFPLLLRYQTSKRRWLALRLGLYKTILTKKSYSNSKRHKVVYYVSQVKRSTGINLRFSKTIFDLLINDNYSRFHEEIAREVVGCIPDTIYKWLEFKDSSYLNDYYLGLYIALLYKQEPKKAKLKWIEFYPQIKDKKSIDILCLQNNIEHTSPNDAIESLNHIFDVTKLYKLEQYPSLSKFRVDNLYSHIKLQDYSNKFYHSKVSILITAHNSESTIAGCVKSLINQTWTNVEIIIINDASTDSTWNILLSLNARYDHVHIIDLPINVGTFAAKCIGSLYASGDYITCQDSDDWAHPQKIYEQVKPLVEDSSLIATTSQWLRVDENGNFHSRHFYPFLRQNPASPMFRYQKVKKEIGLWHAVRTGADSEFYERLKLHYGKEKIVVIKKPLTIASHRNNSLMTSKEYGAYTYESRIHRLDYWEAWRLWHIDRLYNNENLYMPNVSDQVQLNQPIFEGIPSSLSVSKKDLKINLDKHIYIK